MSTRPKRKAKPAAWVVVANHARARMFQALVPTAPLQELEDLANPAASQRERELVSDRPGHVVKGRGGPTRSMAPRETHKERAADQFAGKLCRRLARARVSRAMDRLYLIAEPEFLGLIRKHLDFNTRRLVAGEVSKDVTWHSAPKLRALLPRQL